MPPEPLILAFDTSAAHCAVALLLGDEVLENRHEEMSKGQAERLFPLLEEVLAAQGKSWRDLDAIACGTGPGNFTGIRISVAAARGLALSLGVPAIGVNSFEALAFGLPRPVLSWLDARRGECFFALHQDSKDPEIWVSRPEELADKRLPTGLTKVGPAGASADGLLTGSVVPKCTIAEAIARIAATRLGAKVQPPAPLYLKAADAAPSRDAPPVILS